MDSDRFIKERTEEFGRIFSTILFFRATVVVGGQKNVAEFLQLEQLVVESSLQSGERHAASRRMMVPIMNANAHTEEYNANLALRDEMYLAKQLVLFCLQLFAELFTR